MKKFAILLILAAGTMWGMIGYFVRNLSVQGLNSQQTVAIRMVISAFVFVLIALIFNRKLFKVRLKDLWCFLGTGVISVATFSFCYFKAIEYSSLSVASILLYTAPAFVMIFSIILFKEKMTLIKAVSIILAFLGCLFVTGISFDGAGVSLAAIVYGVLSGVCYALYSIFSKFALQRDYSPLTITLYTFIFAGVSSILAADVKPVIQLLKSDTNNIWFCLMFAVLSCVLPYITYTIGLQFVPSSTASIVASVEPVVATITGALVFNEAVAFPFGYIGIVLVLLSIVLINIHPKSTKRNRY